MATKRKITYAEPADYIPKSIRQKHGLDGDTSKKTTTKKTTKKKSK